MDKEAKESEPQKSKTRDEAIQSFSEAIRLAPKYAWPLNNRAIEYGAMGDYLAAIRDFDHAIALSPDFPMAYKNRAIAKKESGKTQEALADFAQAIKLDPDLVEAYEQRAILYNESKQFALSKVDHDRAVALSSSSSELLNNRAKNAIDAGDLKSARSDLNAALAIDDQNCTAWNNLGFVELQPGGKIDLAISNLTHATTCDPKLEIAFSNLGDAYEKMGDHEKAINNYSIVLKFDPNNVHALLARSINFSLRQDHRAIGDANDAIIKNPELPASMLIRGIAYSALKKSGEALGDYSTVIEKEPKNDNAYALRCALRIQLGKNDIARRDCEKSLEINQKNSTALVLNCFLQLPIDKQKSLIFCNDAIALDPENSYAYFLRAFVHLELLQFDQVITDIERPDVHRDLDGPAQALLGATYALKGDIDRAQRACSKAQSASLDEVFILMMCSLPDLMTGKLNVVKEKLRTAGSIVEDNPALLKTIGLELYKLDDIEGAISQLKEAARLSPGDADLRNYLGKMYWEDKHYNDALSEVAEAVRLDPKNSAYLRNRALAYLSLKDKAKAAADFKAADALSPTAGTIVSVKSR